MTTTHLVLIGLGAALIAGLLLYNFLQERRFRKQADRMFAHKRGDILLGDSEPPADLADGRIEPRIHLHGAEDTADTTDISSAVVQSLENLPQSPGASAMEEPPAPAARSEAPASRAPAAVDRMLNAYAEQKASDWQARVEEPDDAPVATPPASRW